MSDVPLGANLVHDPSFETDYWIVEFSRRGNREYTHVDGGLSRIGERALSIGGGDQWWQELHAGMFAAGTRLQFSLWIRGMPGDPPAGGQSFQFSARSDRGSGMVSRESVLIASANISENQWQRVLISYQVHDDDERVSFNILPRHASGRLLIDEASLRQEIPDRPVVPPRVPALAHSGPGWSYHLFRTRDGMPVATLDPVDTGTWGRRLGYKVGGETSFKLQDNPELMGRLWPARRTLVVCWDNTPVYAGVIWSLKYQRATGVVSIRHEDIWSIWERRLAAPRWLSYDDEDATIIRTTQRYENWNLRTQVKRVLQMGMRSYNPNVAPEHDYYKLPVVLGADVRGDWTFTHWTYDLHNVADRVSQLASMGNWGGNELTVDFDPELGADGYLQWRFTGLYEPPGETYLHVTGGDSPVIDLELDHDLTEWISELMITGEGSGVDTLYGYRWFGNSTEADSVALTDVEAHSDAKSWAAVNDATQSRYEERRNVQTQIKLRVRIGEDFSPLDLTLGASVSLRFYGDPVIPDGDLETKLLGFSISSPSEMTLELDSVLTRPW